jgi:hypothetical protein
MLADSAVLAHSSRSMVEHRSSHARAADIVAGNCATQASCLVSVISCFAAPPALPARPQRPARIEQTRESGLRANPPKFDATSY